MLIFTESEELNLVTELEDDGEDLIVKVFHLFLQSPQPLKFIVWDLKGQRASLVFLLASILLPPPDMINEQSITVSFKHHYTAK